MNAYGIIDVAKENGMPIGRIPSVLTENGCLVLPLCGNVPREGRYLIFGGVLAKGTDRVLAVFESFRSALQPFFRVSGRVENGSIKGLPVRLEVANAEFEGLLLGEWGGEFKVQVNAVSDAASTIAPEPLVRPNGHDLKEPAGGKAVSAAAGETTGEGRPVAAGAPVSSSQVPCTTRKGARGRRKSRVLTPQGASAFPVAAERLPGLVPTPAPVNASAAPQSETATNDVKEASRKENAEGEVPKY
jgi:hypothetical protein